VSTASGYAAGPLCAVASHAQELVWLTSQIARDAPLYHVADEFTVHASISEAQLREAFAIVTVRHESLRTCFYVVGEVLMQAAYPVIAPVLESADLRGLAQREQRRVRAAVSEKLAHQPFDLAQAPLWRAALLRIADDGWAVVFVAHHAVFDAESGLNLHAEITEQCAAAEQRRPAKLPRLPLRYSAYAVRERTRLSGARGAELLAFWEERLRDLPAVHQLPLDRPRPSRRTFAGADLRGELSTATVRAVTALARAHQTVDFSVLLAAYAALLHARSGADDITVGVPAGGRDEPELRPMIGVFVNMLVIRIDASGDPGFADLVVRVRDRAAEAWKHQDMPFQQVVEHFARHRVPGAAPLYQCGFNAHGTTPYGPASTTAEDELLLEVADRAIRLEYNTALFDASTARGLLDDYGRILLAGLADPDAPLSRLLPRPAHSHRPLTGMAGYGTRPEHVPPRTEQELLVAAIWSQALRGPAAGVFDDFFTLGGHSLQAFRILAAVTARTGAHLTLEAFFANPTIAGLAQEIERILARRTA
jgi:hypothetical protein